MASVNEIARLVVKINASGLPQTLAQLDAVDREGKKASKSTDDLDRRFKILGGSAVKVGSGASGAAAGIRNVGSSAKKAAKDSDDLDRTLKRVLKGFAGFSSGGGGGFNFGRILGSLGPLRGGFSDLLGIVVLLGPALLAISGAAIAVASALAPLVGLAGAAAVGLSAFAQAAGVVALASMGVGGALKEQLDAQDKTARSAITGADQQKAAARAIQSAQQGVGSAKEQVRSASEALANAERAEKVAGENLTIAHQKEAAALRAVGAAREEAKRDLEDMRSSLVRAINDESKSVLALSDAQDALQKALAGPDPTDIADAQDAVADAARGQTQATINLTKAQENLNKVNADPAATFTDKAQALQDVADAQNAIGDAARDSTKAQAALAKLQAGPDPKAVAKAQLDVATAQQDVSDAIKDRKRQESDLKAAEQAGVEGSKKVATALQDVADAHRDVIQAQRAFRDSQRGVADAARGLTAATAGVTLALQRVKDAQDDAKSSARGTALASADLNKKFDALPPAAQKFVRVLQGLKPRLDEIRGVAAAGLFPGVVKGIEAAMRSFEPLKHVIGATATTIGGLAQRAGELVGSKGFGKDLETIGSRNTLIIDRVGRAAIYAADALRHVIIAAGPLTTWLAKVALQWAKQADGALKAGRESGKLSDFFNKTKNVTKTVASIIGNLAEAFFNVGKAAAPFGGHILKSIDRVTARFAAWSKSVAGQHALQDFFKQSTELSKQLVPALGGVLKSFGGLAFRVMPAYIKVLDALGPLAGPLIQAFVVWKIALTGIEAATKIVTAAQWLWNAALEANPIGLVIVGIAALIAGVILAYKKIDVFRNAVNAAWAAIKTGVTTVIDFVTDHWKLILSILTGPFGAAAIQIATHFDQITSFARELPGKIGNAITRLPAALLTAGKWILEQIIKGIKSVVSGITGAASWLLEKLKNALTSIAANFINRGKDIIAWITQGIRTIPGALANAGSWLVGVLKNAFVAGAANFTNRGSDVIGWITDGIRSIPTKLANVGSWLLDTLKTLLGKAKDGITGLGGSIIGWIVDGLKKGAFALQEFLNKIIHVINKLPGVNIPDINVLKKDKNGNVTGLARGGAYARTGGMVNSPITLMGEEAPLHPEFVIPTNPAYRKRAKGLLARAAGALGFASGGIYSERQLEDLWIGVGGSSGAARTMAFIAQAESGGNPLINNGGHVGRLPNGGKTIAAGLWQILGLPFAGDPYDPATNARMAISKSGNGTNLHPWDASRAVWEKALNGGGTLGAIGGAVGKVTGIVGDLLAKGAKFLLDKLPGVDGIPDWLKGTGRFALDKVADYIKGKVAGIVGAGGGGASKGPDGVGSFGGVPMANWVIESLKYAQSKGVAVRPTSGYRPGFDPHTASGRSEHQGTKYPHGAVDFGGYHDAAAKAMKDAVVAATASFKYPLRAPAGFVDDGHASGTGHRKGGVFGGLPFLGTFHDGGVAPEEGLAHVAAGETMTPAGGGGQTVVVQHHYHGPVVQDEKFLEYLRGVNRKYERRNAQPAFGG